ncbi:TPA: shikimate kinase [Candidatus Bathyarchaeota archaeon]|nr:shikimate kinase [Candidatus Bathyarchaeota archaeon]HIJ07790.1 shikimate kinase [Candidatus Bathyarchaeota archaeon]
MSGRARAIAHGAATIVNAIALGKGAAFGLNLWTKAEVQLTDEASIITGSINSDPEEKTALIEKTVTRVFQHFGVEKQYGAKVTTSSNIPIARGLKSSSAAANAVARATVAALTKDLEDLSVISLGVDAAFDAKVTVTGAFDDACASYFGGAVVTDNEKRKILQRFPLPDGLTVLLHVPTRKAYTGDTDVNRLARIKPAVKAAFQEAQSGNLWTALTQNGIAYSSALGYDNSVAEQALAAGALAAGLCGKGPAVTMVVPTAKLDAVKATIRNHEGKVLEAQFNSQKARVVA